MSVIRAWTIGLSLSGLLLLAWADWRIPLGVFLCLWANNLAAHGEEESEEARWG